MNTHDGTTAIVNGYYTELFYYFCDCAINNRQMVAPHPIPSKWQVMGQYRIDTGKKGSIKQVRAS